MDREKRTDQILVIASSNDLTGIIKESVHGSLEVIHASDEKDGLDKARKNIPSMIVLGYIDPPGTAFEMHRKLREGWITKHIPLLVVDAYPQDQTRRVLSLEEGLQIEADDYITLSGQDSRASASQLARPVAALMDRVQSRLRERANTLREAILDPDVFCITWEQIPGRGAFEMQQEELIENARRAAKRGIVHAVSVTDNPGGNPAISTEILCTEVKKLGIEPLVHLAFRDKNRNECESVLYGLAGLGVRNVLMLTGDYPSAGGFKGRSKPVFDLDAVHGLQLLEMMNAGMDHEVMGRKVKLAPTDFFGGSAVSPFKATESELICQYYKLDKKIRAGAKFIIPQLGYDARKMHELLMWLRTNGHRDVNVLANIYILPLGAARIMNSNGIPGAVVSDKLLSTIQEEAKDKDKGRSARILRAAKMYAMSKGMGYAGAHIGGHNISYETLEEIIQRGEELVPRWRDFVPEFDFPQPDGFYFFEKDPSTGLNLETPAPRKESGSRPAIYLFARLAHATLFNPKSIVFKSLRPVAKRIDRSRKMTSVFEFCEHMAKVAMFSCQNCGDCGLFDVAFLCPMSQCPKNQRNGPCGGSHLGWCEVNPEKKCVWVRAYQRLKSHGAESEIVEDIVPPPNWELMGTASWLNFYMGRDHSAKKLGITPPVEKVKEKKADKGEAKGKEASA